MNAWPVMRLDECCEIVSGATPSTAVPAYWDGDVNWATPKDLADLEGKLIAETPRKITKAGLASCAASILPPGSVLFSSRAPIGHVAVNTVPMATNQGFKSFVPHRERIHAGYLFHWLRCHRAYMESLGNGATFKEVSKAVVSRVQVPVPPLAEQRRIAAILDEAEALRAKRRAALGQLDDLPRAMFVEAFGDPVVNAKSWPVLPISDIGRVVTGNTPPRGKPEYYGNAIEWIKSDNLNTPHYYATRAEEGLSADGKKVARIAPAGSILVTCIAGSPDCIGNAAMLDREAAFNQQINALIPERCNPHFIYAQMRVGKALVQEASTAAMKGMVSKSRFEQIRLVMPPLAKQDEFGDRATTIERLRGKMFTQSAEADLLFASIQHRAFRGEL